MTKRKLGGERYEHLVSLNAAHIDPSDDSVIMFDEPQIVSDGTIQKDGTYYDIATLDVSGYNQKGYDDHGYGWRDQMGRVIGLRKNPDAPNGGNVTIDGFKFNTSHPDWEMARDMTIAGLMDFSTGTLGFTDDDGGRYDHRLVDISFVGLGNNDYATVAAQNGFDLSKYGGNKPMTKVIENANDFDVKVTYKNEADDSEVEAILKPGETVEVDESQAEAVEKQVADAKAPESDGDESDGEESPEGADEKPETPGKPTVGGDDGAEAPEAPEAPASQESVNSLAAQVKKLAGAFDKISAMPIKPTAGNVDAANNITNRNSTKGSQAMTKKIEEMSGGERLYKQIQLERNGLKNTAEFKAISDVNSEEIAKKASELESKVPGLNLMQTIEGEKIHQNAMDDTNNPGLIPPYTLLSTIYGCTTAYDDFLSRFTFTEAGLSYGWNTRVGDIDMKPVGYCDPTSESDISTFLQNRTQERLGAHTVICNKLSRFSPTNVVNMVSQGYVRSYQKNLAELVVASLQDAVNQRAAGYTDGNVTIAPDAAAKLKYPGTTSVEDYSAVTELFSAISQCAPGGLYVMNQATASKLIGDLLVNGGGVSGGVQGRVAINNWTALSAALGAEVLVVPNSLMPTLGKTGDSVTIVRGTEAGGNVVVDSAIFFVDPANFLGVTNGGLQFDIDSFSPYEVSVTRPIVGADNAPTGDTVVVVETHSARQRGETVLFGDMYRGGGVFDWRYVGAITTAAA